MDLKSLSDVELLQLLDDVSAEIKERNNILPKSVGGAVVDVLKAFQNMASEAQKK
jgi:hypothetical protein